MAPRQSHLNNVLVESLESSVNCYDGHDMQPNTLLATKAVELPSQWYIPARYVLALWSFLGFINMFTLRMDLNIAILAMVDNSNATTQVMHVPITTAATLINNQSSKFHWSESDQDILLGSFFYGYCSTQILGGYLSSKIGPKIILGVGIMINSFLSMVTPLAALKSYYLVVVIRVLQGLAQGLAQPCMHTMWSKWAPDSEKSWLMTITYSGCQVGTVIATWATGYIADSAVLDGWPLVFYVFGGCGIIWSFGWLLLVHDTPGKHPRISQKELEYITSNILTPGSHISVKPRLCKILRTPALMAIVAAHFANDWGCFALTVCLPSYLHRVLNYHIRQNGFLSSLPFIVLVVTNPLSGYLADMLRGRNILSTKNTRKLVNSIGLFIPSALMFSVCYVDSDRNLIVALLTMAVGFSGFTMAGYSVNHLDIAPTFAGVLYGLTNTIGTTTGFIGPAILASLTGEVNNKHHWIIFFYITSGIFFFGGLVFLLLAEGEPQNWGDFQRSRSVSCNSNYSKEVEHIQPPKVDNSSDDFFVPPQNVHSDNSIQSLETSEDLENSELEALIDHRRQRRTENVKSFLHMMYSF
ncbi:sialin [Biomphalaria pfeifferi]|uniref:Sialin n=1 Tax=Biomphalaria pfeifferi TaxID=112525 RepID=A0AAD8AR03_BIOPF|nr:sialin [Biomphalaria pfeifferi]